MRWLLICFCLCGWIIYSRVAPTPSLAHQSVAAIHAQDRPTGDMVALRIQVGEMDRGWLGFGSSRSIRKALFDAAYKPLFVRGAWLVATTSIVAALVMLTLAFTAATLTLCRNGISHVVETVCLASQIVPILVIGRALKDTATTPSPFFMGALIGGIYSFYPLFSILRDALINIPQNVNDTLSTLPLSRGKRMWIRLQISRPEIVTGVRIASAYIVGGVLLSHSFAIGDGQPLLGVELNAGETSTTGYRGALMIIIIAAAATTYFAVLAIEPLLLYWRVTRWPLPNKSFHRLLGSVRRLGHALIVGALAVSAPGCSEHDNQRDRDRTARVERATLQQEWFAYAGFAGEASAVARTDSAQALEIILREGNESIDPVEEVRRGRADFGVVAADRLLAANAAKNDLVAIGVINHRTPTVFLVREDSPIQGPQDFVGQRVGILRGTNTEYVYRLMLRRQNISPGTIREIVVPFEVDDFIRGRYDVRPAFVYDEPVTMEMRRFRYKTIDPANYGVQFLGTVYFTRRSTAEGRRPYVQRFVNAIGAGWEYALTHPDSSIADLRRMYPRLDPTREVASLREGRTYFAGENGLVLTSSDSTWRATASALVELGLVRSVPPIPFDSSFVAAYHRSRKAQSTR